MAEIKTPPIKTISSEKTYFRCTKCKDLLHIKYKSNYSERCVVCSGQVKRLYYKLLDVIEEHAKFPCDEETTTMVFEDEFNELALDLLSVVEKERLK